MKLTLDDLPHELRAQYLLPNDLMEKGITPQKVIYLVGRRAAQIGRALFITHVKTDDGVMFTWEIGNRPDTDWVDYKNVKER